MVHGPGHLGHQLGRLAKREPATRKPLAQVGPFDVITDDVDRAVLAADFVHADYVRVLELGRGASVAEEQLCLAHVKRASARNLDGHCAVKLRIECHPHAAELPDTQLSDQLKMSDPP